MSRTFVAAALCILALSSCSNSSGSGGASTTGSIIPMVIGNTWVMDTTIYDASGNGRAGGTDSLKIRTSTLSPKDHSTYFDLGYYWLMRTNDGVYFAAPPNYYNAYRYFKYPANPGEKFREHDDFHPMAMPLPSKPDSIATLGSDYRVTSNSVPVTVAAGTFNCYQYTANWYEVHSGTVFQREVFYLCPNTGYVRTEFYSIDPSNTSTLKLRTRVDLRSVKLN